jgi:hypothetical protein
MKINSHKSPDIFRGFCRSWLFREREKSPRDANWYNVIGGQRQIGSDGVGSILKVRNVMKNVRSVGKAGEQSG